MSAKRKPEVASDGSWIDEEGFLISADGEELCFVGKPVELEGTTEPFVPDDRASVEWVLGKMADQEARQVGAERRLKILQVNIQKQIKQAQSKLRWLHERFDAPLAEWARAELAHGKSKTLQLDHGKISFRLTKGTNKIVDMDRAVAWAERNGLEAIVRVKKDLLVTDLMKSDAAQGEPLPFLERTGGGEKCTISAGVLERE